MKSFKISLWAVALNFFLFLVLLVTTTFPNLQHLEDVNWIGFGIFDLACALLITGVGWLVGGLVNGLLVYPKNKMRNFSNSQLTTALFFLLAVGFFLWYSGVYDRANGYGRLNKRVLSVMSLY